MKDRTYNLFLVVVGVMVALIGFYFMRPSVHPKRYDMIPVGLKNIYILDQETCDVYYTDLDTQQLLKFSKSFIDNKK